MNIRLRAVKTLLGMRERQAITLQHARQAENRALAAARNDLIVGQAEEAEATHAHVKAIAAIESLKAQSFRPVGLQALEFCVAERLAMRQQAVRLVHKLSEAAARHEAALATANQAVLRNDQRVQSLREQVTALVQEQHQQFDEDADEEATEIAAMRIGMRARITARRRDV